MQSVLIIIPSKLTLGRHLTSANKQILKLRYTFKQVRECVYVPILFPPIANV